MVERYSARRRRRVKPCTVRKLATVQAFLAKCPRALLYCIQDGLSRMAYSSVLPKFGVYFSTSLKCLWSRRASCAKGLVKKAIVPFHRSFIGLEVSKPPGYCAPSCRRISIQDEFLSEARKKELTRSGHHNHHQLLSAALCYFQFSSSTSLISYISSLSTILCWSNCAIAPRTQLPPFSFLRLY